MRPGKIYQISAPRLRSTIIWTVLATLFISISALAVPRANPAHAVSFTDTTKQAAPAASAAPQTPANGGFVGAEACKICHEDLFTNYEKSPHYKTLLDTRGGPSHQGCEGCHGPGAAHADDPGDLKKIISFKTASAKTISERCMTCHASGKEQMDFGRSVHIKNNVSCLDCHSPHHSKDS